MSATNSKPYEIITGTCDIYFAPVDTEFPQVDETPGSAWIHVGLTEGGCKVSHSQTVVEIRADQVTAPIKAVRSEEGQMISFSIASITMENYALALNQATTGPETDGDGNHAVSTYRGGNAVEMLALLVRGEGKSPEGPGNLQYEVPQCYQSASPETDFTKADKAALACAFNAVMNDPGDPDSFGRLVVEPAA